MNPGCSHRRAPRKYELLPFIQVRMIGDLHEQHWLQEIDGKFVLGEAITSMWVAGLYAIHANLQKLTPKLVQNHTHLPSQIEDFASTGGTQDVEEPGIS